MSVRLLEFLTTLRNNNGEQVQARRLTITVQVSYKDLKMKKSIFDRQFSNYEDYPASSGQAEEMQLLTLLLRK